MMWNGLSSPLAALLSLLFRRDAPEVRRLFAYEQATGPPRSTRSARSPKGEDERC